MNTTTCNRCGATILTEIAQMNCWLCELCLEMTVEANLKASHVDQPIVYCRYFPPTFCKDNARWTMCLYDDRRIRQTIFRTRFGDYRDVPEIRELQLGIESFELLVKRICAIDVNGLKEIPIQIDDAESISIQCDDPTIDLYLPIYSLLHAATDESFTENAMQALGSFATAWELFDELAPYGTREHYASSILENNPLARSGRSTAS